jgi:4-amino-4-deoxy-L-arabinose transferase-like glycosyltransferase
VEIPKLPKLGRTWYKRGTLYWLCRTRTTLFLLILMTGISFFSLALYSGFRDEMPPTVRTVCDGVQVVAACAALVWGWIKQRRSHRKALLDPPSPKQTWIAKRDHNRQAGKSAGFGAAGGRVLIALAAPVMPAFAAYLVGWLAAWTTVREYPSEVGARRFLEASAELHRLPGDKKRLR